MERGRGEGNGERENGGREGGRKWRELLCVSAVPPIQLNCIIHPQWPILILVYTHF